MAYGNNNQGQQRNNNSNYGNRSAAPAAAAAPVATTGAAKDTDTIQVPVFLTKPKREGTKLVASSVPQDKDITITIPAGYSLKVFTKGGMSKNGKRLPDFDLVAQPSTPKK